MSEAKRPRVVLKFSSRFFKPSEGQGVSNQLDASRLINIAIAIEKLRERYDVAIVSSGAIAMARTQTVFAERLASPEKLTTSEQQMMAGVGQGFLMEAWREAFLGAKVYGERSGHSSTVSQVLLTHEDFVDDERCLFTREQIESCFKFGIIPIINENDTISREEITFGDNDHLAAQVAREIGAQSLVLCTASVPGLKDGADNLIKSVHGISQQTYDLARGSDDPASRGGMRSKLLAAATALEEEGDGTPVKSVIILGDGEIDKKLVRLFIDEDLDECTRVFRGELCEDAQRDWDNLSYRKRLFDWGCGGITD
jgi:glutamate 5-kinase